METHDDDAEVLALGNSLWLTDTFVDHPWKVIFAGAAFFVVMTVLCLVLECYWPSPVTLRDLLDYGDKRTKLFDAREAAVAEIQAKMNDSGQIPLQTITNPNWDWHIALDCSDDDTNSCDNILTPEGIRLMLRVDAMIEEDPAWTKMCALDHATGECFAEARPGGTTAKASPLLLFESLLPDADLANITQEEIDDVLEQFAGAPDAYWNLALPLFSKDFSRTNLKAKMVRVVVRPAGPVEVDGVRYSHMRDRQAAQEFAVAEWENELDGRLFEMVEEEYPTYRLGSFGRSYLYRCFYRLLLVDVTWTNLAALEVWIYVCIHTRSLSVGTTAMGMVLFSFPITLVLYRRVFAITNLSALHLVIVFVVLGIGADNIFVLWDAWCQSANFPQFKGDYKKRMAYTFRRASKACLATSSTTAFAFLSNGFSTMMPVSAFGYFASLIVPVNYILIVFYWPAFLIVYEEHVRAREAKVAACCCCRKADKVVQLQSPEVDRASRGPNRSSPSG